MTHLPFEWVFSSLENQGVSIALSLKWEDKGTLSNEKSVMLFQWSTGYRDSHFANVDQAQQILGLLNQALQIGKPYTPVARCCQDAADEASHLLEVPGSEFVEYDDLRQGNGEILRLY